MTGPPFLDNLVKKSLLSSFPCLFSPPPPNQPIMVPAIELKETNCVTKRFVFTASKIPISRPGLMSPTRVEVVTAILYKAAMAASKAKSGLSSLIQLVNMRPRMVPPLSGNSAGGEGGCVCVELQYFEEKFPKRNVR